MAVEGTRTRREETPERAVVGEGSFVVLEDHFSRQVELKPVSRFLLCKLKGRLTRIVSALRGWAALPIAWRSRHSCRWVGITRRKSRGLVMR